MSCSYYTFRQGDYYCNKKEEYVKEEIYYKYCRNWDYSDCPTYKGDTSGGCYLTSACVYAKGLPDDCYELETLRHFRDTWIRNAEGGESIIKQYYEVAPKIVSGINDTKNSKEIYEMIYEKMVEPCVRFIEQKRYHEAMECYQKVTLRLKKEFA